MFRYELAHLVDGARLPEFLGSGQERARGVEADASYKVSDALTLIGGASYLHAKVVESSNAALRGTRKINIPLTSGSLSARYKLDGILKGVSLGGSLRSR